MHIATNHHKMEGAPPADLVGRFLGLVFFPLPGLPNLSVAFKEVCVKVATLAITGLFVELLACAAISLS